MARWPLTLQETELSAGPSSSSRGFAMTNLFTRLVDAFSSAPSSETMTSLARSRKRH